MVTMPLAVVLFVCKTTIGLPDPNSEYTKYENREWAVEQGMMHCKRQEVQVYDRAEDGGAQPLNPNLADSGTCMRIAIPVAIAWEQSHQKSAYRVWRVACPTPIWNHLSDAAPGDKSRDTIVGWQMPPCPESRRGTVVCEADSAI